MIDVGVGPADGNGVEDEPVVSEQGEAARDDPLAQHAPVPALRLGIDRRAGAVEVDTTAQRLGHQALDERMPRNPFTKIAHIVSLLFSAQARYAAFGGAAGGQAAVTVRCVVGAG